MRPLFGRLKVLSHATCYGSFLLFWRLYFRDWNRFLLSVNATVGKDWHGLKLKKVGPTLLSFNLYLQMKITKNKIHCYCFLVKFVWYGFVNFLKNATEWFCVLVKELSSECLQHRIDLKQQYPRDIKPLSPESTQKYIHRL